MRIPVVVLLSLVLLSCTNTSKEKMGIYVYNMLYACEKPSYKIFRVDDLTDASIKLKDKERPLDISTSDEEIAREIEIAINSEENNSSLIGRDIDLEFEDPSDETEFKKQVGINNICYLYYFEGYFKKNQMFFIQSYKLILKMPNCISEGG